MSVSRHEYTVNGTGIAENVEPSLGWFGWDDSWVPHMRGEVTIPLESVTDLDALDPRQTPAPRMQVAALTTTPPNDAVGVTGVIRNRLVDRATDTVRLRFAGRESVLLDWGAHSGVSTFWNQGTIINLLRAVFDDATPESLLISGTLPQTALNTDYPSQVWAHRQGLWDFIDQVMTSHDLVLFDRGDSSFWYLRQLGATPDPAEYTMPYGAIVSRTEEVDRDEWADYVHIDFTASPGAGTYEVIPPAGDTIEISNSWGGQSQFPKPQEIKEATYQWDSPKGTDARRNRAARRVRNKFQAMGEQITGVDVSNFELRPWQAVNIERADGSTVERVISSLRHDIATQQMTLTARHNRPSTT